METRSGGRIFLMLLVITQCRAYPASERSSQLAMEIDEQQYLAQFGYLPPAAADVGHLMSDEVLKEALMELQQYGNIRATGKMDSATKTLMAKPRCGMPDRSPNGRSKRYAVGRPWTYSQITWRLHDRTVPPELLRDISSVREDLRNALAIWARGTPLNFQEMYSDSADIQISFQRGHHAVDHQSADTAFDGPGKVLAHAFYPGTGIGGDAHFDLEEKWKTTRERDPQRGTTSLSAVAVHEFGHSLGLMHSKNPKAIMYAYLVQDATWDKLPDDDMQAIHELYPVVRQNPERPVDVPRPPVRRPPQQPERQPPNQPERQPQYQPGQRSEYTTPAPINICSKRPDAIARMRSEVLVFSGDHMWRLQQWPTEQPLRFTSASNLWKGLPVGATIDAVYEEQRGKIRFFVGQKYYEYTIPERVDYVKRLTDLGLPAELTKLDAATVWNGKTYLFAGRHYWHLDETKDPPRVDHGPHLIDDKWRGVDTDLEAVFQWPPGHSQGNTWFFRGRSASKFDPGDKFPGYPQPLPFCLEGYEHFSGAPARQMHGFVVLLTFITIIVNSLLKVP